MLGSLREFIDVELLPEMQQPNFSYLNWRQKPNNEIHNITKRQYKKNSFKPYSQHHDNQNQQNHIEAEVDYLVLGASRQNNSRNKESIIPQNFFKKRTKSTLQEYTPQDKSHLLNRFNKKNHNSQHHKKNVSDVMGYKSQQYQSIRKPLYENSSLFIKNQITKDYIAKNQLKRKHNLLRAMIRTNQNDNQNEGVSEYQQSFKRLYEGFNSIYAKPILEYKNLIIEENDHEMNNHMSLQINKKPKSQLNNRKRIQFQNCLNWAKKHKKKSQYYAIQLGKNQTKIKQQNLNQGHHLIAEISKKLKAISTKTQNQ